MSTPPEDETPALLLDIPLEDPAPAWHELPTAREQLAAKIMEDAPHITAYPWVMEPENVTKGKPVASVYRANLNNGPQANVLRHDLTIDLYVSLTDGPEAEAEAEDALDEVLLALQRMPGVTWTDAKRVSFGNPAPVFAGYSISVSRVSKDHYLTTVLAEKAAGAGA